MLSPRFFAAPFLLWQRDRLLFLSEMTASDSQYKCCCNTHVHNAIIAIAIVGWLSGGGALVFIIISFLWPFLPLPMLAGLGNLLLLLGRCTKTACLYWCYFVTQALMIIGNLLWCVFLFIWGTQIYRGEWTYEDSHGIERKFSEGWGTYFYILGGVGILFLFLNIYFFYIAVKAYKYLTQVLSEHHHTRDAVMIQQNQSSFSPSYPQVQQGGAYPGQGFQVPPGGFTGYPPVHSDSRHEFKPPVGGQQVYPNV
ncbi:unnamed protein product [Bursaphelenchus okinawaensis]|uniref:Uncharacterized protein n=1 Tax=Bursaphelenchus okinawaensis TaxID=465554 RepID=A0A811L4F9_9BILA|nr:unnamed protein product [Bursaphelenchus okinawaensis]CAG9117106.1 unnamed protein product [Bursaphelenchus okinawaensis]